ncbi:MAG TPA: hypothetical protein VEC60_13720 [Reyranella sp.]|nr:hypothetical protein [Reyranella sp.]
MISRLTALGALVLLAACSGPPPPKTVDAFKDVYTGNSAAVPVDAPVRVQAPVGLIFSENFEAHIGAIKDSREYWGKVVPASLTNTVVIADTDPLYLSGKVLEMLKRRFPDATPIHDFNEAVQHRKRAVILIDLRIKYMEPYGDRTQKVGVDLYFFSSAMTPVSKLTSQAEYKVPFASMDIGMQRMINQVTAELDGKINALVR